VQRTSTSQEDSNEILEELANQCSRTLTEPQQKQLLTLLLAYRDIFATSPVDLGRATKAQYRIWTEEHAPIQQPVRRVPAGQREQVRKELQDMNSRGIIKPSSSPWALPLVLVKKKDESIRFCVD
jgi:hypothetical protein